MGGRNWTSDMRDQNTWRVFLGLLMPFDDPIGENVLQSQKPALSMILMLLLSEKVLQLDRDMFAG